MDLDKYLDAILEYKALNKGKMPTKIKIRQKDAFELAKAADRWPTAIELNKEGGLISVCGMTIITIDWHGIECL